MKKLILSAAILLGSLSTFAQANPETTMPKKPATTTQPATTTVPATNDSEETTTDPATTQPPATPTEETAAKSTTATQVATSADGYKEIKMEELPAAVSKSLKKAFPEAKVNKVFINDKKQYKLEVENGEKVGNLFADANGKWIQ